MKKFLGSLFGTLLALSSFAQIQPQFLLVTTTGDDSRAPSGAIPYATIAVALAHWTLGQIIAVGEGTFSESTKMILPPGAVICGFGRKRTVIENKLTGLHCLFVPNQDTYIGFLSVRNEVPGAVQLAIGSVDFANYDEIPLHPTNFTISDVELIGTNDGSPLCFFQGSVWRGTVRNSVIRGKSGVLQGGSSIFITYQNTLIEGSEFSGLYLDSVSTANLYNTYVYGKQNSIILDGHCTANLYLSFLDGGPALLMDSPSRIINKQLLDFPVRALVAP